MIESYEYDTIKKEEHEAAEQTEYEKQLDFFSSDTDFMFETMNSLIERIRELEKEYDFDFTDKMREQVKDIFDLELRE